MRILITSTIAAMVLVLPAAAGASISLDGPTGTPVVAPGGALQVSWTGACPEGKLCGLWNYTATDPGAVVAFGMGSTPHLSSSGVVQLDQVGEVGDGWEKMTSSPHRLRVKDYATAGRWNLVVSWNECEPMKPGAVNLGTCPQAQSALLPYVVRATIGLPGRERAPNIHRQGSTRFPRGKGLLLRANFGCNARPASYRGTLRVERRVRVKKRFVWRLVTQRTNLPGRAVRTSECWMGHDWRIPDSLARTTQLRYSYRITTRGVTPAAPARTLTSRPFPRGNVGVGYG